MEFKQLNLNNKLLNAIETAGLSTPTPIQEQAIPVIMEGRDLRASAQTGTGKTAAFVLPALDRLMKHERRSKGPRILILTPTRELAMQVAEEAAKFSINHPSIKTVCIFGGMPYPMQNRQLGRPYDILVATPGRLLDHLERRRIDLRDVEILILDEADRMLDMGFIDPVEHIARLSPSSRQTLLFSATLKKEILKLSERLLKNPVEIAIVPEKTKHENIAQHFHAVNNIEHKHELLNEILNGADLNQAIVFTATKRAADELARKLSDDGHQANALHGDMNQRQRTRTIKQFRDNQFRVLVATDVAARGIDILTISHVINFDLPMSAEDYVHRIGRTGRAGNNGTALSFAARKDRQKLKEIEKFTGITIPLFKNEPNSPQRFPSKRTFRPPGKWRGARGRAR